MNLENNVQVLGTEKTRSDAMHLAELVAREKGRPKEKVTHSYPWMVETVSSMTR